MALGRELIRHERIHGWAGFRSSQMKKKLLPQFYNDDFVSKGDSDGFVIINLIAINGAFHLMYICVLCNTINGSHQKRPSGGILRLQILPRHRNHNLHITLRRFIHKSASIHSSSQNQSTSANSSSSSSSSTKGSSS